MNDESLSKKLYALIEKRKDQIKIEKSYSNEKEFRITVPDNNGKLLILVKENCFDDKIFSINLFKPKKVLLVFSEWDELINYTVFLPKNGKDKSKLTKSENFACLLFSIFENDAKKRKAIKEEEFKSKVQESIELIDNLNNTK